MQIVNILLTSIQYNVECMGIHCMRQKGELCALNSSIIWVLKKKYLAFKNFEYPYPKSWAALAHHGTTLSPLGLLVIHISACLSARPRCQQRKPLRRSVNEQCEQLPSVFVESMHDYWRVYIAVAAKRSTVGSLIFCVGHVFPLTFF